MVAPMSPKHTPITDDQARARLSAVEASITIAYAVAERTRELGVRIAPGRNSRRRDPSRPR